MEAEAPEPKTRSVDPDVAKARSALGVAVRTCNPEAITAARDDLALAKAVRLRQDAKALVDSVLDRSKVRMIGFAPERVTREDHEALVGAQRNETEAFKAEHGPPAKWDEAAHTEWANLLDRHTAAHEALGCSQTSPCRMARGRS